MVSIQYFSKMHSFENVIIQQLFSAFLGDDEGMDVDMSKKLNMQFLSQLEEIIEQIDLTC